jgi:Ergosterol biosynthesis ERG4/ERG24 family
MSLAWSFATGFETPITYFYPAYFLVLLMHRQIRDDENCHIKYVRRFPDSNHANILPEDMERIGINTRNWFLIVSFRISTKWQVM